MSAGGAGRRIEGLDVLRGVAILLVLVRHSWPDLLGNAGIVGVVLFFTLSGYLITGLLTADIRRFGRVRYGRFYRNRAIRLLPALMLLLAGYAVVTLVWNPLGDNDNVLRAVIVGITYVTDIPFDHGTIVLSHLWTLSVEEQFYILWPIILALSIHFNRVKLAIIGSAAAIVVLLLASYYVAAPDTVRIYTLPTSWCVAMVIGAAASFGMPLLEGVLRRSPRTIAFSFIAALVILIGLTILPEDKTSLFEYLIVGPATACMTIVLVTHVKHWQRVPTRALAPVLWLGTISYAAYLWNYLIRSWMGTDLTTLESVAIVVLTLVAATISWYSLERPAQALKAWLDRRYPSQADAQGLIHLAPVADAPASRPRR